MLQQTAASRQSQGTRRERRESVGDSVLGGRFMCELRSRYRRGKGRCSQEEVGNRTSKAGKLGQVLDDGILLQNIRWLIGGSVDHHLAALGIDDPDQRDPDSEVLNH